MPKKADALQGALDLLILKTLAARGPLHGYGIALHVESVSDDVLRMEEGSLYPALHRMEQDGWVRSTLAHVRQQPPREVLRDHAGRLEAAGRGGAQLAPGRRRHPARAADSPDTEVGGLPCRCSHACIDTLRTGRLDRELDEEMRFHIDMRAEAYERQGLPPDEARRQALRRFGSPLSVRERVRDVRLLTWLDSVRAGRLASVSACCAARRLSPLAVAPLPRPGDRRHDRRLRGRRRACCCGRCPVERPGELLIPQWHSTEWPRHRHLGLGRRRQQLVVLLVPDVRGLRGRRAASTSPASRI